MEYKQIVAITGMPGLFQIINTKNNGAIVKNLTSGGVNFISARKHQMTPLESIEVFTTDENIRLDEVFTKMKDLDKEVAEVNEQKDKTAYRVLFKKILPNFDEDRVYTNDIKKIFNWYPVLKENDLLNFEAKEEEAAEEIENDKGQESEENSKAEDKQV